MQLGKREVSLFFLGLILVALLPLFILFFYPAYYINPKQLYNHHFHRVACYKDYCIIYVKNPEYYYVYPNQTYSMQPAIMSNCWVILEKSEKYYVGDIVDISESCLGQLVEHRIVGFDETKNCYITKGDNNKFTDGCFPASCFEARVVAVVC